MPGKSSGDKAKDANKAAQHGVEKLARAVEKQQQDRKGK